LQEAAGVEPAGLSREIEPFEEDPGAPEGGSTDVADVSWIAPTLHLTVATAPLGIPWHAWPVVAASGSAVGHRGMIHAGKALAATAVDLLTDAELLAAVREEFEQATRGVTYESYLPPGPPPLPGAEGDGEATPPSAPPRRPFAAESGACTDPRPEVCTQQYDPVCVERSDSSRRTFGNACTACADSATVRYETGPCAD
jgi:hypothetical protein